MSEPGRVRSLLDRLFARSAEVPRVPFEDARARTLEGNVVEVLIAREAAIADALCVASGLAPGTAAERNVFGRRVRVRRTGTAAETLAVAEGMAVAGLRIAAFAPFAAGVPARLRALADRRAALVAYLFVRGEEDLDALSASGTAVAVARDGDHALDLGLVGRRLAERALLPVVVAIEDPEVACARGTFALGPDALVREYLGDPDDTVTPSTPAQTMLFGVGRRRIPRWFDPDRPVMLGAEMPEALRASAAAGRRLLLDAGLAELLEGAIAAFEGLAGRPLPALVADPAEGAREVLVTLGSTSAPAAAGIERARASGRTRLGLVSLAWRTPLPEAALRRALARAEKVVVVVRGSSRAAGAPWLASAVRAAAPGSAPAPIVAAGAGLRESDVEPLLAASGAGRAEMVWLGAGDPACTSVFPKREALLQRVRREFPALGGALVPPVKAPAATARGEIPPEPSPPLVVRRFKALAETYDNVARFWGETAEPLRQGDPAALDPDPFLALGAVPPYAATFADLTSTRATFPVLVPEACTGCGRCWSFCPDSAIGTVATSAGTLLETAARLAAASTETGAGALGRIGRALRPIGTRVDGALARGSARCVDPATWREAWTKHADAALEQPEERAAMDAAFAAIAAVVEGVPLAAPPRFFAQRHVERKGTGELLLIAFDPRACRGCGICATECPEQAIRMEAQTPEIVVASRRVRELWEELPDTAGETIARASRDAELGPLAAALLSRHALFAVAGGGETEPGSGSRLVVRQSLAVIEAERQKALLDRLAGLEEIESGLRAAVRDELSKGAAVDDLGALEAALEGLSARRASASDVLARIEALGERHAVDAEKICRLAHAATEIAALRRALVEGGHGAGRARYGLVIAAGNGLAWASRFPDNPFGAPAVVESAVAATSIAVGLAETLVARCVEETRVVRRARLALESPADLPARARALEDLRWTDLDAGERALATPVLLVAARGDLDPSTLDGLVRVQGTVLPVKVLLVDDGYPFDADGDPLLPALARRAGFVLAASPAYPTHLAQGVAEMIRRPGPALVRLHAPSPARHGFAKEATIARAREAVVARVYPLLRYDPALEGGFAGRLSLEGNPDPEQAWAPSAAGEGHAPSAWAAGETRFAGEGAEQGTRLVEERWRTLQELAGLVGASAVALRARAKAEAHVEHEAQTAALRAEFQARLAQAEEVRATLDADRLRRRLLALAGIGPGSAS